MELLNFEGLSAGAIFETLGAAPLNTKKNILEYIEVIRKLSKETLTVEQVEESYELIEKKIMEMGESVKPNTIVFLKNELRKALGKFVIAKANENAFLKFFKQTYEEEKKDKAYTFVLADLTSIREQQILDTLKTINTYCFNTKLTGSEMKDIRPMIERIVDTQNVRLINQLRSMEGIRKAFRIRVVEEKGKFKIV